MWLQDLLPKHMPNARIMTYGYNSDSDGENALLSTKGLNYAAAKLLEGLAEKRLDRQVNAMLSQYLPKIDSVQCNNRCPIIFIAHDLGGIVVKKVNLSVRMISRGNTDGMNNNRPCLWRQKIVPLCPFSTTCFDWYAPSFHIHSIDRLWV